MKQWYRTDKRTGEVEPVSESYVKERLRGNYHRIPEVLEAGKSGSLLQTPFAYYEYRDMEAEGTRERPVSLEENR